MRARRREVTEVESTLFRDCAGKGAPAGQSCRSRLRPAIPSGGPSPLLQKTERSTTNCRCAPRKGLRFSGTAPEKGPLRGSPVGASSVRRFRAGDRAPSYKRPRDRQQIVNAHPVRAYAFPGLRPEKGPLRGSPVGASSVRRFRAGDRAPSYKRPRDRQQIVDAHPVRAYRPQSDHHRRPRSVWGSSPDSPKTYDNVLAAILPLL